MKKIAIFFGSSTGNTRLVAEILKSKITEMHVDLLDLYEHSIEKINEYQNIILGISTWGDEEPQEDWMKNFIDLKKIDLAGKTIALFGLGDQGIYKNSFADGLGIVYDSIKDKECKIIGDWSAHDYNFKQSKAIKDGRFVGLVIDEDQQSEYTEYRINEWLNQILPQFN